MTPKRPWLTPWLLIALGMLSAAAIAQPLRTPNPDPAADALRRARAVHDAWMPRRNPETELFPQSLKRREWNALNVAADFFCFQYAIAVETDAPSLPALRATLARERALNGIGLCDSFDVATGRPLNRNAGRKLFGTTEYLKDGLISLYERTGDDAVRTRIVEIADAIVSASTYESKYGLIASRDSETNGNILQALSRVHFMTGDPRYADLVGRTADAVIMQMFPKTRGVPVRRYDYTKDEVVDATVHLRDHGNETAVGLSEAYALAVTLAAGQNADPIWAERANRWAAPIAAMYETLLTRGRNADGLLTNRLHADGQTGVEEQRSESDAQPCDNWGYLLSGAILFTQTAARHNSAAVPLERREKILGSADAIARAVMRHHDIVWEPHAAFPPPAGHPDGLADSIESAIYIAFHRPALRDELLAWADIEIARLFALQRADGFVTGDYLDGNFIRTCLLYADARSPRSQPPAPVRWRGRMNLPWDWPRINCWPQWESVPRTSTIGAP